MQNLPLSGVRVLEFGGYISAPYAESLLSGLRPDVVKIEKPGGGDDFRRNQGNSSPYFRQYNAGKRSLAVDLKSRDGVALIEELIPRFDVVINNLRPGKMDAIGLGHEHCVEINPQIIYVSVTGFGNGGPLEQRPAYDSMGQAFAGLYSVLSDEDSAQLSGTCLADLVTALTTATGVLAALVARSTSGAGQQVETSVMEAISALTIDAFTQYFENGHVNPSRQSRHPQAQNFCLKTSTGDNIAIHLSSSEKFWISFLGAMDRRDLADDPRFTTYNVRVQHYLDLATIVNAEFATRPLQEWEERLTAADVPYAPVLSISEYLAHPQTEWLQLVNPEHEDLSLVRPPWRFNGARPPRAQATPLVGEHSREIAGEVYDESRIEELLRAGVIFAP